MWDEIEFESYVKELCEPLGRVERHVGLRDYLGGLMLPLERKSVEPLAAATDLTDVSAKHQALHHFVPKSAWSDEPVLARVRNWVLPELDLENGNYWIVDDTGLPKKGRHSVGVARQYCGQVGKPENCQCAVSLSIATDRGSLPLHYRLYLPEVWANDPVRRGQAGVPADLTFASKPAIALAQIRATQALGLPAGVVLADAGYGNETAFRESRTEWGLSYAVGIQSTVSVWEPGGEEKRGRTVPHTAPP
jgi:SRSO17 transposase